LGFLGFALFAFLALGHGLDVDDLLRLAEANDGSE